MAWDVRNRFIVDGSSPATGGAVNPTPTIGARAVRAGEYIARNFDAVVSPTTTPSHADARAM